MTAYIDYSALTNNMEPTHTVTIVLAQNGMDQVARLHKIIVLRIDSESSAMVALRGQTQYPSLNCLIQSQAGELRTISRKRWYTYYRRDLCI